ncbi:OmpW family protein [Rariglobus hedericola]|uniref:OmpW family protein n=1 Tax=Rariglobus hedericola TaxID=2597822 RepID=A0A556QSU5_9BACT|nr:OmpW family protein [Rariglobus hedericola]
MAMLGAGLVALAPLHAASPWSVRIATAYLQTTDGSTNKAIAVDIEDKLIPEFDISYAFTSHWSADLVLTVPQEHEVKVNGAKVGTFKHLPPTLLAKYTFTPIGRFTPYVGAGVNFTLIFDDDLGGAKLDSYSVGPAGQVGFDYKLADHWSLNADVKRAMLRTDVKAGGVKLTEARLDPWIYSLGLRYQF